MWYPNLHTGLERDSNGSSSEIHFLILFSVLRPVYNMKYLLLLKYFGIGEVMSHTKHEEFSVENGASADNSAIIVN